MGRWSASLLVLALGAAGAMALASCGGGNSADLLPGTTAKQINSNLDQVQLLVDQGDCVGAEDAVAEVAQEVQEVQEVDPKLKAALEEGATHLSEVVTECEETSSEETEPALESDVEAEVEEEEKKPKKEKPEKEGKGAEETQEEPSEGNEGPELPPQANGKGEEKGGGPADEPEAEEAPSGGVGPNVGIGE